MCLTEFNGTKWGELMKEEGHQKGIISLVKKGKISVEDAAEELGLDVSATEKLLADNGIQVSRLFNCFFIGLPSTTVYVFQPLFATKQV